MNLDVYNCWLYQSLFYMICYVILVQLICILYMVYHVLNDVDLVLTYLLKMVNVFRVIFLYIWCS